MFYLHCPSCKRHWEPAAPWFGCDRCVDPAGYAHWLEVGYDLDAIDPTPFRQAGRVWNYAALLPVRRPEEAPTLGEGNTPMLRLRGLNRELGLPNLHLKLETVNPTAAFKDRFHTVGIAVARELGYRRVVAVTAGNHGTSCAAYAAVAGMPLLIITDPHSSPEQRRLMHLFGARVTAPTGPEGLAGTGDLVDALVREHAFYPATAQGTYCGPANPYGVEGYKTIGYEIAAQLGGVPDRICVPTSAGDALIGPYRAFQELNALGIVEGYPRMTACQSAEAGFVAEAMRLGMDHLPWLEPHTFALSIGDPTGCHAILEVLRSTGGDGWARPDSELLEAMALLGRHGICVEGASASTIAALRHQVREGQLDPEEQIVAVLTGSGMKWPGQVQSAIGPTPEFLPDQTAALVAAMADESGADGAGR